MASQKISQLPQVITTSGGDLYPLVQSGSNYAITFAHLQASIAAALTPTQLPAITLTGNVTGSGAAGTISTTISAAAVINSMLAAMANNTVKGNTSGISASPSDLTLGTATEATSAVLTLSGWSNATIGSPTIQVKQSTTSQSGYLSSTDWNTFNGKQAAGSYITAITGDLSAAGPGSAVGTLATVNGNVGTFSFATVTVNAKGLVTAVASGSPVTSVTASSPLASSGGSTPNLTIAGSSLTEATSAILTITGGSASQLTATTIQVKQSSTSQSGYLSSTDWNIFNNKQAAGSYITALTGDVTASGPGSSAATLATVNLNVGTFSFATVTVNAKGLVTAVASGSPVTSVTASSPLASSGGATPNLTITGSSLTEATSAVLTIAGGSASQLAATTIQVKQSTTSQSGYLSSTDWNTFNGKQSALTFSNSLVNSSGTVTLVNDSTSPGNSLYYGTNASGTKGYFSVIAGSGVTTIGTIDSQAAAANGLVISGVTLYAQSASATAPGMVNLLTQTFAGSKTLGSAAADAITIGAASSTAVHKINGGMRRTSVTITATTYTVDATTTDYIVYTDSTSNAITVTLPTPTAGRELIIFDLTGKAGTNNVTVTHHASETINGQNSIVIANNYGGVRLTTDGTNWSSTIVPTSGNLLVTSGTTYTTPVNVTAQTRFKFTLVGGGGGGGGTNTTNRVGAGGGGAGSGYLYLTGLAANTAYTIAIGAAGTAGTGTPTNGGNGGNTTLTVGVTTYTASGGAGGSDTAGTNGGAGGTTTNLTVGITGQNGGAAVTGASSGNPSGPGGNTILGLGGAFVNVPGSGLAGTGYGAGGSGGFGSAAAGGAGTAGCILVEWEN